MKRKIYFRGLPDYTLKDEDMVSISNKAILLGVKEPLDSNKFRNYLYEQDEINSMIVYAFPDDIVRKFVAKS